jgi:hypothetical protein
MLLPESTFKYGSNSWQKGLPFLDFETSFVDFATPFPNPLPVEP